MIDRTDRLSDTFAEADTRNELEQLRLALVTIENLARARRPGALGTIAAIALNALRPERSHA